MEDEPYPGIRRASFDGERATLTRYRFEPSRSFPLHRHSQEQVTPVEESEVEKERRRRTRRSHGG